MYQETLIKKIIPPSPGVYLFKNTQTDVIYVGKALNLKKRLKSYQHQRKDLTPAKQQMLVEVVDIDYIVVSNEEEALLLEANLIQKYQPRYNIILKDDKSFVYLKIDYSLKWPELMITRRPGGFAGLKKSALKKARYFGPYISSSSAREILRTIKKIFPICLKPQQKETARPRPCFNYQIHRCPGACVGEADQKEYLEVFLNIERFLRGDVSLVINGLRAKMRRLAIAKKYELAAKIRNQIFVLEKIKEKQKIISVKDVNQDYLSLVVFKDQAIAHIFVVRHGKLLNSLNFRLANINSQSRPEIIGDFIEKYYQLSLDLPREVLVDTGGVPAGTGVKGLKIVGVQIGRKKELIDLGALNAREYYRNLTASWQRNENQSGAALSELRTLLGLKKNPERLECYDISNIQGTLAVGSMVVLTRGELDKKQYRKFKIKNDGRPNDVGMMREVLSRRFGLDHLDQNRTDHWPCPDLIVLDGGKPQLNMAIELLRKNKIDLPVLALAKRQEEIFLLGQAEPIILPSNSAVLRLIQRIRDEAHRFALSYYSLRQRQRLKQSVLDNLPGVGPVLKKKLIQEFGSVKSIREASRDNLIKVVGRAKAKIIRENI